MFYVKWSVWKRINNDLRHVIDFWLEFKRVTCKSDDLIKRNALWFFRSHTFSYICHSEMFVFRILCHLHTCVLNWVTERFWCEEVKLFLLGKFETLSVCLSFSLSPLPPSIPPSSPLPSSLPPPPPSLPCSLPHSSLFSLFFTGNEVSEVHSAGTLQCLGGKLYTESRRQLLRKDWEGKLVFRKHDN